jgi:hypothetical protein
MRTLVGAVTLAGVLLLAGCDGGDPIPTLPPTPSATPIFASEEEALAAAEDAYAAYLAMSDLIASEGGTQPERIAPFVTAEQLPDELDGSAFFVESGIRSVGASKVTKIALQQFNQGHDAAEIVFYACVDVSGVAILDHEGADVTPADRPPVVALEVAMVGSRQNLLLADSDQWVDSQFCS